MSSHTDVILVDSDVPKYYSKQYSESAGKALFDRLLLGDLSSYDTSWRVSPMNTNRTVKEHESIHISAKFSEFRMWLSGDSLPKDSAFNKLPKRSENVVALYADYKHVLEVFGANDLGLINWKSIPFHQMNGGSDIINSITDSRSTIWLGTPGSHTPLHYDTYSSNLVLQLAGRKLWKLWAPSVNCASSHFPIDSVRMPFEESTVYSNYDPRKNQTIAPDFEVILGPGDVLIIPKHWWHYVETVSYGYRNVFSLTYGSLFASDCDGCM